MIPAMCCFQPEIGALGGKKVFLVFDRANTWCVGSLGQFRKQHYLTGELLSIG